MATVNFLLEKRKDPVSKQLITENVPILMDFNFDGKRLQYYTGFRIDAKDWDDGLQRDVSTNKVTKRIHEGKVKRSYFDASTINNDLARLKGKVIDIYTKAKALEITITKEYIRKELNPEKYKLTDQHSVWHVFDEFLSISKATYANYTLKKYKGSYRFFKKFMSNKTIHFSDISLLTLEKFKAYLIEECGHSNNTVVTYTKGLKQFLKWAYKMQYTTHDVFKDFKIDAEKEPAVIFLEWEELMHLHSMYIANDSLRCVRDVFCFGCFTGQRYSDIANLKPEHIHNNVWVNAPIKTRNLQPLYIPLNNFAQEIIDRYKGLPSGKALPVICNQKMNDQLKKLGELAKLYKPVTVYKFVGANRIEKTVPKYKLLTTHIMRKTFVSNALVLGMQTVMIREFTGHKSERNFKRYLDILIKDKKAAMDLFNKPLKQG